MIIYRYTIINSITEKKIFYFIEFLDFIKINITYNKYW